MFPWFDFLVASIIVWETVVGYLYGVRVACIRLVTLMGAVLISLPFAANCAVYLRPILNQTFNASIAKKALAASSGQGVDVYLGPWQNILGVPTSTGSALYFQKLLTLAINVSGLCFLVIVIIVGARLIERLKAGGEPGGLGALTGLSGGICTVMTILVVLPVLALGEPGTLLVSAMEGSWTVKLFGPIVQVLVKFIALYV